MQAIFYPVDSPTFGPETRCRTLSRRACTTFPQDNYWLARRIVSKLPNRSMLYPPEYSDSMHSYLTQICDRVRPLNIFHLNFNADKKIQDTCRMLSLQVYLIYGINCIERGCINDMRCVGIHEDVTHQFLLFLRYKVIVPNWYIIHDVNKKVFSHIIEKFTSAQYHVLEIKIIPFKRTRY